MSSPRAKLEELPEDGGMPDSSALADALERAVAEGRYDAVAMEDLQRLMAALCKIYAARVEEGAGDLPVQGPDSVTPSDAMAVASGLLRVTNVAMFELAMWQSWTGK